MIEYKIQGSYIETHLFRLLASVASLTDSEGALARKALVSFQSKRANEIARIRKELQENTLDAEEIQRELQKAGMKMTSCKMSFLKIELEFKN